MSHAEHITRGAARALGHAAESWAWNERDMSLDGTVGLHDQPHTFAPLRDPGDAFTLEAILCLDVTYTAIDRHVQMTVRCPARSGQMTYVTLVPQQPQASVAMRERMRAVTQFAAILDNLGLAEN
jgi:hypothetical protein